MIRKLHCCVLGLLLLAPRLAAQEAVAEVATGTIELSAALRNSALEVVPIALTRFVLISASGDSIHVDTGRDGLAVATIPAGDYHLRAVEPVALDQKRYQWSITTTVRAAEATRVDLSNLNATAEDMSTRIARAGRVAPEADLFQRFRSGVVRVEAGLGHGSGFIADTLDGVILTNAHVIHGAGPGEVSVVLDSVTRVAATILARDSDADIAVLRIAPRFIAGRVRMPLSAGSGDNAVVPGERLVALGYPLSQNLTMTSGIASGVREGAIMSDVNINPGNSGGPLLNLNGNVVGVNTFADQNSRLGPGVAGSVLISQAAGALREAGRAGTALPPDADSTLPSMPLEHMSASGLRAAAAAMDLKEYRRHSVIEVNGRFTVSVQTPLATFVEIAYYEEQVGKDRRRREERAGLTGDEQFSEIKQIRDWAAYVGENTTPVVAIQVEPNIGETGGSIFGRVLLGALTGAQAQATYKFKGDVRGVHLFRGDSAIQMVPLRGGHAAQSVWQENQWVELKDVADQGYYIFDPEIFRPAADGTTPVVVVAIEDLKNPGKWSCRVLERETVARAWNDFEDYYREHRGDRRFNAADRKRKVEDSFIKSQLRDRCSF